MPTKRKTGLTLFVELGQEQSRFLCATISRNSGNDRNNPNQLSVAAFGEVESSRSVLDVTDRLAALKLKPKNLVLLLPRSEFEVSIFQLPELDSNEYPQLIANLVSESMDSLEFTTDYILNSKSDSDGKNALTWTLTNETLNGFRDEAKQCGLNLVGVTSHAIGSISLWRDLVQTRSPNAVIVTIANRSIDFSVIYNHEVTHIRTIPFVADDVQQVTTRLVSELQRTVLMTGDADESESTRLYLFGSPDERKPIAEALTEEFDVPVSILNPIDNTDFNSEPMTVDQSEDYAHLLGVAKACFFDSLDIDLTTPKQPETSTLPWRRIATWTVLAASLLGLGGFLIWEDANHQLQEIAEKREEFDSLATDARRVVEMKDELAAIRNWRSSEVIWLDQLDQLSRKLPPREQSLIRRISMAVDENGKSKIDLSVEVSDNSLVVGLEKAIRDEGNQVNSKRVSESAAKSGAKWNFETTIRFQATPPKLSFVSDEPPSKVSAEPTEQKQPSTDPSEKSSSVPEATAGESDEEEQ